MDEQDKVKDFFKEYIREAPGKYFTKREAYSMFTLKTDSERQKSTKLGEAKFFESFKDLLPTDSFELHNRFNGSKNKIRSFFQKF